MKLRTGLLIAGAVATALAVATVITFNYWVNTVSGT